MASRIRPETIATNTPATPSQLVRKRSSRVWSVDADEPSSARSSGSPGWSPLRSGRNISEENASSTMLSPSHRRSSVLVPASDSKARRASLWDTILAPVESPDDDSISPMSPLRAVQRAFGDAPVDEGSDEDNRDGSLESMNESVKEMSSDSDDEIAILEHHLIAEKSDMKSELGQEAGVLSAFMAGSTVDEKSLAGWDLSKRVAHKWRWFVLATVHLRFADCAEQQEDLFSTGEEYSLLANVGENHKPTRRATLFGNVIGVYRTSVEEGTVKMMHCLGDDVSDISQALRVLKSNSRHRVQKTPQLFYNDVRPSEPRFLPDASNVVEEGGLLAALQIAKNNREKAKAVVAAQKKLGASLSPRSSTSPLSPASSFALPQASLSTFSPALEGSQTLSSPLSLNLAGSLDGRRLSRRLSLMSIGKAGSRRRSSVAQHHRSDFETAAHVAHMEALREEQRLNKLHERKDRIHETMEFFAPRPKDIFHVLRQNFDPDGFAHCTNVFYSPANLLKREALRFNREIQFLLRTIWRATDSDDSGAIDEAEFKALHSRITCALLGRAASEETVRFYLFKQDWLQDSKGFKTLNRSRLEDSFFTLADRFCVGIECDEYIACLNRLLSRIVKYDPETGKVGLRSEEDIWVLNDIDPLVDKKVFQFKSKKERNGEEKTARNSAKEADKTSKLAKKQVEIALPDEKKPVSSLQRRMDSGETIEDFNEETFPKYIVVFDSTFEDGEKDVLPINRGEIVYPAPKSLSLGLGPPPDPEGWVFCTKIVNNENVFGWCPESRVLFLTRKKECQDENDNSADASDTGEKVPTDELETHGVGGDTAVREDLLQTELDADGGNKRRQKRLSYEVKMFRRGEGVLDEDNLASGSKKISPVKDSLRQRSALGWADAHTHSETTPARSTGQLSKTLPVSVFSGGRGRQRGLGGGNLRFPGFSFEPTQALSELTSSQHLQSDQHNLFLQAQSAGQKKRTMAGMTLPQAQPSAHMVAAAARRYAESVKEASLFYHYGKSSTAVRAFSTPRLSSGSTLGSASIGDVPAGAPQRRSRRQKFLSSVAASTLSMGTMSLADNTLRSPVFRKAGVTGPPQMLLNPLARSRPSTGHIISYRSTGLMGFESERQGLLGFLNFAATVEPAQDTVERAREYAKLRYLAVGSRSQSELPQRRTSKPPARP